MMQRGGGTFCAGRAPCPRTPQGVGCTGPVVPRLYGHTNGCGQYRLGCLSIMMLMAGPVGGIAAIPLAWPPCILHMSMPFRMEWLLDCAGQGPRPLAADGPTPGGPDGVAGRRLGTLCLPRLGRHRASVWWKWVLSIMLILPHACPRAAWGRMEHGVK